MIRNGIKGLTFKESTPDKKKIDIRNSQITNMDGNVLWAINCHLEASNTEFSNASDSLAVLSGGKYQFTHCTMANYMPIELISGSARRLTPCLTLADNTDKNVTGGKRIYPLLQAYFDNCIIDGDLPVDMTKRYGGEIVFSTDSEYIDGNNEQFNYRFNHCIIKTKAVIGERFNEVLFIGNTTEEYVLFIKSNERIKDDKQKGYDYIFDFRLANESPGIGKADRSVSEKYPVDRFGMNRLTSSYGPSIGAYEYVPQRNK
jgi:hypothetical protein